MHKTTFTIKGHPNMLATHKTTLEFTKDKELSVKGDCIMGVEADFSLSDIKKAMNGKSKARIVIEIDGLKEEINGLINHEFNDDKEIVIRLGEYASSRTLLIRADKPAMMIDRKIIEQMKDKDKKANIIIDFY